MVIIMKWAMPGICQRTKFKEVIYMYVKKLNSQIIQNVGEYGIVRSIEQTYLDNGNKIGGKAIWYDICLDKGYGDIIYSCKKIK